MHRRSAAAEDIQRRHRRRHRQAADRLRLPCPDHELSGAGHADDRADRIRIEGRARSLLRCHDRDPAGDRRDRNRPLEGRGLAAAPRPAHRARHRRRQLAAGLFPRRRLLPGRHLADRTNTGARSAGSTMSMATATWCARVRRWRITRRRRSDACAIVSARARAQRIRICQSGLLRKGWIAGSSPAMTRSVRKARSKRGFRVPAPQAIVGQFGAAPPAMDRVVPAEILGPARTASPSAVSDSLLRWYRS